MEYSYIYTKEDNENFRLENNIHLKNGQKRIFIHSIITLIAYFFLSYLISLYYALQDNLWWILLTLVVVATILYINDSIRRNINRIINTQNEFEPEEILLEILDGKVIEKISNDYINELKFTNVLILIQANSYIGLGTKQDTLIIPKKIFKLACDYDIFIDFLVSKLNNDIKIIER